MKLKYHMTGGVIRQEELESATDHESCVVMRIRRVQQVDNVNEKVNLDLSRTRCKYIKDATYLQYPFQITEQNKLVSAAVNFSPFETKHPTSSQLGSLCMRDSLNFRTLFIAIQSRFSPMSKLILHFSLLLIIFSYHRSEAITRATTASLHRLRDASLKLSALSSCSETIENEPLPPRLQSPVLTFESIEQFLDTIDRAAPNQLTVVLYYAHYCKVCHKANIPYKKLAYKNSDIRFTRLETSPMTVEQFKMLGISKVPFVHIYRNGICVAAFSTKWQLEARLAEVLQLCQQRSLGEWRSFMSQLDLEIQKNKQARIAL